MSAQQPLNQEVEQLNLQIAALEEQLTDAAYQRKLGARSVHQIASQLSAATEHTRVLESQVQDLTSQLTAVTANAETKPVQEVETENETDSQVSHTAYSVYSV